MSRPPVADYPFPHLPPPTVPTPAEMAKAGAPSPARTARIRATLADEMARLASSFDAATTADLLTMGWTADDLAEHGPAARAAARRIVDRSREVRPSRAAA